MGPGMRGKVGGECREWAKLTRCCEERTAGVRWESWAADLFYCVGTVRRSIDGWERI